jgi:hypothetical protein
MTHDELIKSLLAERYQPIPRRLDPSDTPANCAQRQADLLEALAGFVYTPEPERKRNKITKHLRAVRNKAA